MRFSRSLCFTAASAARSRTPVHGPTDARKDTPLVCVQLPYHRVTHAESFSRTVPQTQGKSRTEGLNPRKPCRVKIGRFIAAGHRCSITTTNHISCILCDVFRPLLLPLAPIPRELSEEKHAEARHRERYHRPHVHRLHHGAAWGVRRSKIQNFSDFMDPQNIMYLENNMVYLIS